MGFKMYFSLHNTYRMEIKTCYSAKKADFDLKLNLGVFLEYNDPHETSWGTGLNAV